MTPPAEAQGVSKGRPSRARPGHVAQPSTRKPKQAIPGRPRTHTELVNEAEQSAAAFLLTGVPSNTIAAREWSDYPYGEVDKAVGLAATVEAVEAAAKRVNAGDLSDVKALLAAQTVTLNALFVNLAHRAKESKHLDHLDRYLRLALRAQSQCRAACEALALLKNPPLFPRQTNIAAQQVVNNGTILRPLHAGNAGTRPNELLEAHGERLDGGATGTASGGDRPLEAVETIDGAADGSRQGTVVAERLSRRPPPRSAGSQPAPERPSRSVAARDGLR